MPFSTVPTYSTDEPFSATVWNTFIRDNLNGLQSLLGARTYLINGGFGIWQRGTSITAAAGATTWLADKWQMTLDTGASITASQNLVTVAPGSMHSLYCSYGNTTNATIFQTVDPSTFLGQTVSFSIAANVQGSSTALKAYLTDGITTWESAYHTGSAAWETLDVTATLATNATTLTVGVALSGPQVLYLDNATLVLGNQSLPFSPLDPSLDLARCKPYYQIVMATTRFVCAGSGARSSAYYNYPVAPVPNITTAVLNGGGRFNVGTFTLTDISTTGFRIELISAAGGDCYSINDQVSVTGGQ